MNCLNYQDQTIPEVLIEGRKYAARVWKHRHGYFVEVVQGNKVVRATVRKTKQEAEEFGRRFADI
jgi:hypothetical protein